MAERILVVDDDRLMVDMLGSNLSLEGYDVSVAWDGREALEMAADLQPALVLLDWRLPGLTGVDVCRGLRADFRTTATSVIILTAQVEKADMALAFGAGADDYVTKPFDLEDLLVRMDGHLRRGRELRGVSPLTGLPGSFEVTRQLQRLLEEGDRGFALVHADLDNFKAYNDTYGFLRGDTAIRLAAGILASAVASVPGSPRFLSHIGGDDFAALLPARLVEGVAEDLVRSFDERAPALYEPSDRRRGLVEVQGRDGRTRSFGLVALSLGIASGAHRAFTSVHEVAHVAGEMKQVAKAQPGSTWRVDRRRTR